MEWRRGTEATKEQANELTTQPSSTDPTAAAVTDVTDKGKGKRTATDAELEDQTSRSKAKERATKPKDEDDDDDEVEEKWEEIDAKDKDENDLVEEEEEQSRKDVRKTGKGRRTETLGKRKVDKEVYKKGLERKRMKGAGGAQWSR